MGTTEIFRVETENGHGPYRGGSLYKFSVWDRFFNSDRHPTPHRDEALAAHYDLWDYVDNYIFGFSSLDQLYEWFYDDDIIILMIKNGFAISKYELPSNYIIAGSKQIIFKKSKRILKGRINLYTSGHKNLRRDSI